MLEREVILKCHCLLQTFNLCISCFISDGFGCSTGWREKKEKEVST